MDAFADSHHKVEMRIELVGQKKLDKGSETPIPGTLIHPGQPASIAGQTQPTNSAPIARLTIGDIRRSGLLGMWRDRTDISDSSIYARELRQQAEQR